MNNKALLQIFTGLIFICLPSISYSSDAEDLYAKAKEAYVSGDCRAATNLLTKCLHKYPELFESKSKLKEAVNSAVSFCSKKAKYEEDLIFKANAKIVTRGNAMRSKESCLNCGRFDRAYKKPELP